MNNNILNNQNKEYASKIFHEIIDIGVDFKLQKNVLNEKFDFEKYKETICRLPENGENMEELIKEIRNNILPYCTNFSSSNFMGFPDAGNSIAAISGSVLTDFCNRI